MATIQQREELHRTIWSMGLYAQSHLDEQVASKERHWPAKIETVGADVSIILGL